MSSTDNGLLRVFSLPGTPLSFLEVDLRGPRRRQPHREPQQKGM